MMTLIDVVNRFYEGKTHRHTHEDGSYEQLVPIFPLALHEFRYTFVKPNGEFAEWSVLAMEFVMDPHSGISPDNWEEV